MMAMIASGISSTGARYRIFDDAYANVSPEEMAMRRDRANRAAYAILMSYAKKEEEKRETECGELRAAGAADDQG